MIRIKKIQFAENNGKARITAPIELDGCAHSLWIEVDSRYKDYLCWERSDAFVLGLLHYAMLKGHDIIAETPMTDRLYLSVVTQLLPLYSTVNDLAAVGDKGSDVGFKIRIKTDTLPEILSTGNAVGTGCSCGVDSLHVFATHPEITHACLWNLHGSVRNQTHQIRERGWQNLIKLANSFSDSNHLELVVADTNFDQDSLPQLTVDNATTFGNLFCIFALQKLWRRYYIASGSEVNRNGMRIVANQETDDYEQFIFPFLSLASFVILSDGPVMKRIDKVRDLLKYDAAKKFLNVCWLITEDGRNCSSHCPKCMRTMLELDCLNALDEFSEVFDVGYYRTHEEEFLAEYLRNLLRKHAFSLEIRDLVAKKNFSMVCWIRAWFIVVKKIFRKILRGWSTSNEFTPN